MDDYKLSCELIGHSMDVRGVGEVPAGIVSVSRDKTAKIWKTDGRIYFLNTTLTNHTNFVSCVYYLEDEGWICTGSNDSTICIYAEATSALIGTLKGHKSAVCTLAKGLGPKTLLSGSWDQTARVWQISESGASTFKSLEGHQAAVWAVTSWKPDKIVTGSADKNIMFWNQNGEKLRVLKGHTDCVRSLIALDNGFLISAGNDAVIRYWDRDGECVKDLHGHENYIYTIALHKHFGENVVVSSSEDSTIRMWDLNSGQLGQAMLLPAQSVWSVACLRNGDIVTGTSDGVVRVFTKDPSRTAPPDALKAYEAALAGKKEESSKMLGGIKHDDLPGLEALNEPGTEEAIRVVKHPDGKVFCYQYMKGKWNLVGDVLGASGGTQKTSGKKLHEGKEYDYVFDVDISDNAPPIKLPYNRTEDPWHAAQTFIHKHNLPQVYLEQVANFIITNSDGVPAPQPTPAGYVDPFTGGSRYIPGSGSSRAEVVGNADPFTGGSSYTTKESRAPQVKHFPVNDRMTFDNCDAAKILDKLREFNAKTGDNNTTVSDEVIEAAVKLAYKENDFDKLSAEALKCLLRWPKEILFPVLDVARLAVRTERVCAALMSTEFLENLLESLSSLPANQLMAVRCFANMLVHPYGSMHLEPMLPNLLQTVSKINKGSPNLQIAIATLLLNLSVSQMQYAKSEKCRRITEATLEFLKWCTDLEAAYRAMQTLGNITCTPFGTEAAAQVASLEAVASKIRGYATTDQPSGFEKVTKCAQALALTF